jgi:hypothetical protein
MSDSWLKRMLMLAIVLLVLHAVGTWTYSALGIGAALVSALLVGAVSIFAARMATRGEGNHAWFVVPTLVFTAVPLAWPRDCGRCSPSSRAGGHERSTSDPF